MIRAAFTGVLVAGTAWGQGSHAGGTPSAYEVASIKPTAAYDGRVLIQLQPGGGIRTSGATLKYLVTLAYDSRAFQISGGPGWIASERFDVVAKADGAARPGDALSDPRQITREQYQSFQEQMRPKLQSLLADRFRLVVHRETREAPVYALVIGKSGAKLAREQNGFRGLTRVSKGRLAAHGATLEMLANALSNELGRPVLDRTGMEGDFDFTLEWTPELLAAAVQPAPGSDTLAPLDPNGPSLFTAIQDQLGLRLESQKGPVEMIVIDRVERPSEN